MKNEVKIALNICTFQREEFIHRNLSLLQASDFFNPDNPQYYGRLHIFVVDNGSSLQLPESLYVHCIYNRNTGGSGGFQRGIEEIRKRNEGFTHVIFMDDDVAFDMFRRRGKTEQDCYNYILIGCYEPAVQGLEMCCSMAAWAPIIKEPPAGNVSRQTGWTRRASGRSLSLIHI